jgi:hypothetical protein
LSLIFTQPGDLACVVDGISPQQFPAGASGKTAVQNVARLVLTVNCEFGYTAPTGAENRTEMRRNIPAGQHYGMEPHGCQAIRTQNSKTGYLIRYTSVY